MANERSYLVQTETGEDLGPVDQEALIRLAECGKITAEAKVRSVLIPRWDKAISISFLKPILIAKQMKSMEEKKVSFWLRFKNQILLRAEDVAGANSIVQTRAENFDAASMSVRIFSALIDWVVVFLGWAALTTVCYMLLKHNKLNSNNAAYILLFLCWFWTLFYFVFMISAKTQTIGQKFWGIFLIRTNAMKFYAGRSFFYTVFMLIFGILTPLHRFFSSNQRSWQEILSGTRLVRTKMSDNSKVR